MESCEVAELLLARGIDRDAADEIGRTALHLAAGNCHLKMTELLLDMGVNVNTLDGLGRTPLDHAIRSDSCRRQEMLSLLHEHGGRRGSDLIRDPDWLNCLSCKWPRSLGCRSCLLRPDGRRTGEAVHREVAMERLTRAREKSM